MKRENRWLNINQDVSIKLKPTGEEVMKEKGHKLKPDENGYITMSIWKFMYIFGEYMKPLEHNEHFNSDIAFNLNDMWTDEDNEAYCKLCKEIRAEV